MEEFNKNNTFKTPEGYFENFADELSDKLGTVKFELPNEDGFAIPENYFDGLHKNIERKLDTKETKVVQLHSNRKYYYAAASVAAVVLLAIGLNWNSVESPTFTELADSEIEAYFDSNEYGLSSYEIAEMLNVADLDVNDILENHFDDENVVDYLNENINDFEELNLEEYE